MRWCSSGEFLLVFIITVLFSFVFCAHSNRGQKEKTSKYDEKQQFQHSKTGGTICVVVFLYSSYKHRTCQMFHFYLPSLRKKNKTLLWFDVVQMRLCAITRNLCRKMAHFKIILAGEKECVCTQHPQQQWHLYRSKKRAHIHQKPNGNSELNKISHKKMDNEIKKNENKERSFKNKCDGWSGGREKKWRMTTTMSVAANRDGKRQPNLTLAPRNDTTDGKHMINYNECFCNIIRAPLSSYFLNRLCLFSSLSRSLFVCSVRSFIRLCNVQRRDIWCAIMKRWYEQQTMSRRAHCCSHE